MKKMVFVLIGLITLTVFPAMSEAASQSSYDDIPVVQNNQISPRAVYTYRFSYVPPQKFNGMTRVYYEYIAKDKVYIGYYM
ncbi:hypothetical protein [Enterococcus pallens]|uniref:Uncharacterized protein n=1 Tax=Enterococcus pallens ATCC BAA-351 TaxID=1158607 RepID=R2SHI4_9ENTE|nr:hypothetical protein [Enterococcus pallens]EOH94740.1 hypothetical protein UAU_01662 [Enterococcus pallens ATCC BAA-351]EOU14941.1 hypothetical protein I588_04591 [Enterococcus pallens ATCC BAA-351]OJG78200.1 hypothetical protein RV10_GL001688 [Enterococcus pallens]